MRGGGDQSSACYSLPNRLTILHSSQIAASSEKESEMITVRSKVSENMLKIRERNRPWVPSLRPLERSVCVCACACVCVCVCVCVVTDRTTMSGQEGSGLGAKS